MAFKKMAADTRPPRQWALVGYPGSGKSTFAAQMRGPILAVDADHRFAEVMPLAQGDVYELSDTPADNVDAERIAAQLRAGMPGSGVRTIVVDSLSSIIAPLTTAAVMDNDAGRNKNRIAAFKGKALAMRLLQDAVTMWGADSLWVYHLRTGMDAKANEIESTSVSTAELARLRRSLNASLRIVEDNGRRGIHVDWARRGRSGMTLWDESGSWQGMPDKVEAAMYEGLSREEQDAIEQTPRFSGPADAIAWGMGKGVFRDEMHAKNAYDKLKREEAPSSAAEMFELWVEEVERRVMMIVDTVDERALKRALVATLDDEPLDPTDIDPDWGNTDPLP